LLYVVLNTIKPKTYAYLHELLPTKQNTPRQVKISEELSDTLHYAQMK